MPWSRYLAIGLALVNGFTAVQTLNELPAQSALNLPYSPLFRAGIAALWTIIFLALTIGFFRRSALAVNWFAPIITAYCVWSLLWLLVFARADYDRGRAAFQLAITLIVLAPIWWWRVRAPRRTGSTPP